MYSGVFGIYCVPQVVRVAFLFTLLVAFLFLLAMLIAMLIKMLLKLPEGHSIFQFIQKNNNRIHIYLIEFNLI